MTTTLKTLNTKDGIELSDDEGKVIFLVVYEKNFWCVRLKGYYSKQQTVPLGFVHSNAWFTLEAAEFYALALYANDVAIEAADANRDRCGM